MRKIITIFFVLSPFLASNNFWANSNSVYAFKIPPPQPAADQPHEEPLPPPPEPDEPPPPQENGPPPPPPPPPTPTPCIPNWCFVQQTICCFDPICIFLGETTKGSKNRCDRSPGTLKFFSGSPSKSVSIISKIGLFIQSFFR